MVLKVGKLLISLVRPQTYQNKTEKSTSYQATRTGIRLKIWRYLRIIHPKVGFLTEKKLDYITINHQDWPQNHTWQHLKISGVFDRSSTNAARLISSDVAFQWWRHGTLLWGDRCEKVPRSWKVYTWHFKVLELVQFIDC